MQYYLACFHISSASGAGMAAAAGEVAEDEKHLATVEKVGSDFIPLVVECFGVCHDCFCLEYIMIIADYIYCPLQSGVPHSLARKNLLQLSFALWINNFDIDDNLLFL